MLRGTVVIDRERCKGCALCVGVCPQHLLQMDSRYNSRGYRPVMLSPEMPGDGTGHCTGCAVCALLCPDVVFTVYRESKKEGP